MTEVFIGFSSLPLYIKPWTIKESVIFIYSGWQREPGDPFIDTPIYGTLPRCIVWDNILDLGGSRIPRRS